jgi:hypothetical protein
MKSVRTLILLSLAVTICLGVNLSQAVILDDFTDNAKAPIWLNVKIGDGVFNLITNNRVEVTLIPSATGPGGQFQAGRQSKFQMATDNFEIVVNFSLLTWPEKNGTSVGLNTSLFSLTRTSLTDGEYIIFSSADQQFTETFLTNTTAGKLRIKRVGSKITGSFWTSETGWHTFPTYTPPVSIPPLTIGLGAGSLDTIFGNQKVIVALDNFAVNTGRLLWPVAP